MVKMPKMKKKMSSSLQNIPHSLGSSARALLQQRYNDIFSKYEEELLFLEEILAECKKAFSSNELTLLPKTPSAKNRCQRTRRPPPQVSPQLPLPKRRITVTEEHDEEISDNDVVECTPPKKVKMRSSKNPNTTGSGRTRLQSTARNNRAAKNRNIDAEDTVPQEPKKQSLTRSGRTTRQNKSPPIAKISKDRPVNNQQVFTPNRNIKSNTHIYSPLTGKTVSGHVKSKVTAYEQYISPVQENVQNNTNIPETPEYEGSPKKITATLVNHTGTISPKAVQQTPNCTPTETRRSVCKSLRRSLKALPSQKKKSMMPNEIKIRHEPQHDSNESITEEQIKKSRLKLNKKKTCNPSEDKFCRATNSESLKDRIICVEGKICDEIEDSGDNVKVSNDKGETVTYGQDAVSMSGNAEVQDNDTGKNNHTADSNVQKVDEDGGRGVEGIGGDEDSEDEVMLIDELPLSDSDVKEGTCEMAEDAKRDSGMDKSEEESGEPSTVSDTSSPTRKRQATGNTNDPSCNRNLVHKPHSGATQLNETHADSNLRSLDDTKAKTTACRCDSDVGCMNTSKSHITDGKSDSATTTVESATGKKTRKKAKSKGSQSSRDSSENVQQPVRQSARTRQRIAKTSSTVSDSDNDTKSVNDVTTVTESSSRSRTKKSKAQKAKDGPISASDSSEADDPFVVPEVPQPRTTRTKTRKRQMEEDSDTELDTSLSKRSRTESQSAKVIEISEDSKSAEKRKDSYVECSEDDSPVQSEKIVRPVTSLLQKVTQTGRLNTSGITSFLHRSTPPAKLNPKEIQAARKKELEEKQRKERERLQKREALMKQRIEEQRKKREERMQNAAKAREQKLKNELEMKNRLAKKLEERSKHIDEQKEEKLREEEKQKLRRLKKMQEAEERRKQEEEERIRKLKEQEEEEQRLNLMKQRQREFEEAERLQKLAEERRQKEERQAELERERRAEMERMKALEEEKERERIKQKEERERILAKERAERERLELEKKKQKELEYNQKLERLRELEKRRLMEEEKRRQEIKEREAAIHTIVNHKLPQTSSSITSHCAAPKCNLNTTHTMESASNPNSYEMTPVKKYKTPSFDNYDISDLRSDQSTDEEDAPRKRIPTWALGANLKVALINQYYNPPDLDKLFDKIVPPNLNEIFAKKKARFNHRTSSAHWDSPLLKHGPIPEHY